MVLRFRTLCAASALLAMVGCDAAGPADPAPDEPAFTKARHWEAYTGQSAVPPGRAALSVLPDSVDIFVTFVESVVSPEAASDDAFSEQDVRRRNYVRDGNPGVAATVAIADLPVVMALLEASPLVKYIEPDFSLLSPEAEGNYVPLSHNYTGQVWDQPSGTFTGQMLPWNVTLIGGDRSSARSGDGSGTVDIDVYVIDSGVDHPDVDVVESVRFFSDDLDPGSPTHGNHVAATIAATDDASGMVGVAPGARVHSLDVFDGSGSAPMSRLIAAVAHVTAAKKADPARPIVVNMSVGAYTGSTGLNALDEAIQASVAAGVVYVVSAGNQRVDAARVSPARVPEALTVAAYDANHTFAIDFSNYGPLVDILAPGVRVVSAADGGRYARLDGTSMAAPHVAGAAALVLAANPAATPSEVASTILASSRDAVPVRVPTTTSRAVWVAGL